MSVPERDPETRDPETLARITTAARALFAHNGVAGTRMEDVAIQAGISRPYLYRFVSGRDELIELVLLVRCREMGADLEAMARLDADDLAEAIVDQVVAGATVGRDDPEFSALSEAMDRVRLNMLLTSRESALHEINTGVFGPLFARATARGLLRTDMSIDAMVEWLQGIMTMLAWRHDQNADAMRGLVRGFVLPSLLKVGALARASQLT